MNIDKPINQQHHSSEDFFFISVEKQHQKGQEKIAANLQNKQFKKQIIENQSSLNVRQEQMLQELKHLTHKPLMYQLEQLPKQQEDTIGSIIQELNLLKTKTLSPTKTRQTLEQRISYINQSRQINHRSNKSKYNTIKELLKKVPSVQQNLGTRDSAISDENVCCVEQFNLHTKYRPNKMPITIFPKEFHPLKQLYYKMKLLIHMIALLNAIGGIILIGCNLQDKYIQPQGTFYQVAQIKAILKTIYRLVVLIKPQPTIGQQIKVQFVPVVFNFKQHSKSEQKIDVSIQNDEGEEKEATKKNQLYVIRIKITPLFIALPKIAYYNKRKSYFFNISNQIETLLDSKINKILQTFMNDNKLDLSSIVKLNQFIVEWTKHVCRMKKKDQEEDILIYQINQEIQTQEFEKIYQQIYSQQLQKQIY